ASDVVPPRLAAGRRIEPALLGARRRCASRRSAGGRRRVDRTGSSDRRALPRRGDEDAGGRAGGNRSHRERTRRWRAGRTMRTPRVRQPDPLTGARPWPKEAAMAPIVKICGLSDSATLGAALDTGADMVGFVFFPKSPRHVDWTTARALGRQARGRA